MKLILLTIIVAAASYAAETNAPTRLEQHNARMAQKRAEIDARREERTSKLDSAKPSGKVDLAKPDRLARPERSVGPNRAGRGTNAPVKIR